MTNGEIQDIRENYPELKVKTSDKKVLNGDQNLPCCKGEFDHCDPSCEFFRTTNHFDYKHSVNNTSLLYCEQYLLGWKPSFE